VEQILREGTLETKCRKLIEAARAAGGPDNITAILIKAPLNGA
jgi:serine/threonine protein phosphatase PrpC